MCFFYGLCILIEHLIMSFDDSFLNKKTSDVDFFETPGAGHGEIIGLPKERTEIEVPFGTNKAPEQVAPEPPKLAEIQSELKELGDKPIEQPSQERPKDNAEDVEQIMLQADVDYLNTHPFTGLRTVLRKRFANLSDKEFSMVTNDFDFLIFEVASSGREAVTATQNLGRIIGSAAKLTKVPPDPDKHWKEMREWQLKEGTNVVANIMGKRKMEKQKKEPLPEESDEDQRTIDPVPKSSSVPQMT
jgi:hypothetical protein